MRNLWMIGCSFSSRAASHFHKKLYYSVLGDLTKTPLFRYNAKFLGLYLYLGLYYSVLGDLTKTPLFRYNAKFLGLYFAEKCSSPHPTLHQLTCVIHIRSEKSPVKVEPGRSLRQHYIDLNQLMLHHVPKRKKKKKKEKKKKVFSIQ
jgi:hypothetical protein